uniref:Uncharacterized protein n=1 Tax=Arundo donax TaxID=35708 RepID=A0A0A9C881_ARUDO
MFVHIESLFDGSILCHNNTFLPIHPSKDDPAQNQFNSMTNRIRLNRAFYRS